MPPWGTLRGPLRLRTGTGAAIWPGSVASDGGAALCGIMACGLERLASCTKLFCAALPAMRMAAWCCC